MKNSFVLCMIALVLGFYPLHSLGQVRLPQIVSDGMVLQRDAPVKMWGWASPGEKVSIRFDTNTYTSVTAVDGRWQITLPSQKAGGPYEITINGKNQIVLKNILFGDVWLCAGQSNMVLPMSRVAPLYGDEIKTSKNSMIRQFLVPVRWNYNLPQQDLQGGEWTEANPGNLSSFSAVGYFFARDLYAKYKIPVGIILCAAGGSAAESWISEDALKAFPEQYAMAKQLSDSNYMKSLLSSENEAQQKWFIDLGRKDKGHLRNPWYSLSTDDSAWPTIVIPSSFGEAGIPLTSGVVWFRKKIDLPESFVGKKALLELGRIVDSDSVFVNGLYAGNTSYQYPPRRYTIAPGLLNKGTNSITIRVISESTGGGLIKDKPYRLTVGEQTYDLTGEWKYQVGATCDKSPMVTFFPGKPLGLYNAMLYPLVNYTLKGMVWYQGESNTERASEYKRALSTLIGEWRKLWGQGELPFLFVQLPDFMEPKKVPSESDWATLRYQQLKTLSVPNTAMAVTIGLGEWNDIHPLRKKEIGQRLALAAQKLAYNDLLVVASGPMYQSMQRDGDKIELYFSNCGSGLTTIDGKELTFFSIAGVDKKFYWAKAQIMGNKIIVWSDRVSHPEIVRYAWADNPAGANLCNREGLPASPFTTE